MSHSEGRARFSGLTDIRIVIAPHGACMLINSQVTAQPSTAADSSQRPLVCVRSQTALPIVCSGELSSSSWGTDLLHGFIAMTQQKLQSLTHTWAQGVRGECL